MKKKLIKIMINLLIVSSLILGGMYYSYKSVFDRGQLPKRLEQTVSDYRKSLYELGAQDFQVTTHDNHTLSGIVIKRPNAKRVVLICHGYRRNKELMFPVAQLFDTDSLVLFDFRAHGKSSGDLISFGLHEQHDIDAVIKYISHDADLNRLPIIGMGFSMGAATLILAQAKNPVFKALILDSSFARLQQAIERGFILKTRLPSWCTGLANICSSYVRLVDVYAVEPAKHIGAIECPILLIHSCGDKLVPMEHAQLLFDAAKPHAKIWKVEDAIHGAICKMHPQEYKQQIQLFLETVK